VSTDQARKRLQDQPRATGALQQVDNIRAQLRALRDEYSHQHHMCTILEANARAMPDVEVMKLLRTQQSLHANWEEKLGTLQTQLKQITEA
jgi:hypothetical protein